MPLDGSLHPFKVGDKLRFTEDAVRKHRHSSVVNNNPVMEVVELVTTSVLRARGVSGEMFYLYYKSVEFTNSTIMVVTNTSYKESDDLEASDKEIIEQYLIKAGIQ